jgi:hypothetical protein
MFEDFIGCENELIIREFVGAKVPLSQALSNIFFALFVDVKFSIELLAHAWLYALMPYPSCNSSTTSSGLQIPFMSFDTL